MTEYESLSKKERAKVPPYRVPSGPYLKYYEEWLKTPEGQRIASEEWGVRVEDIETLCPRGEPARKAEAKRQAK